MLQSSGSRGAWVHSLTVVYVLIPIWEPTQASELQKSRPPHTSIFGDVVLSSEHLNGSVACQQPAAVGRSSSQQ